MKTTPEQRKRAAIYTRISNDPKLEGLGVARQLEDCAELAGRLKWDVVAQFDDNDISAYNGRRRPGFEAMLDAVRNGQIDAILCWHTDRLYRSMKDLERLIEVADAARISIKTVQSGDMDLSTSAGRMMARILGSVARQESEHKGERQVRANLQKAQLGEWSTCNRTFGYDLQGHPVAEEAAAYRQAVADVLDGKSVQGVARKWNAAGLKTTLAGTKRTFRGKEYVADGKWSASRVRRLLVNPKYAGLKAHRGKVVGPGTWPALIDPETYERLVTHLSDPSRIKCVDYEKKWQGSGLYRCGKCGATMKAQRPAGGKRGYVCRERSHLVRQGEPLDDYVTAVVLERLSQPDAHLLIDSPDVNLDAVQDERAKLRAKLEKLTVMFTDDKIDAAQFERGTAELRTKLAKVDAQLARAVRTSRTAALLAGTTPGDGELWDRWQRLSATVKTQVLDELVVVTLLPIPQGLRGGGFDPQYVDIQWRKHPAPDAPKP